MRVQRVLMPGSRVESSTVLVDSGEPGDLTDLGDEHRRQGGAIRGPLRRDKSQGPCQPAPDR